MEEKLLQLVESVEEYSQDQPCKVIGFEFGKGGEVVFALHYSGRIPVKELFALTGKLGLEPHYLREKNNISYLHVKLKEI